LGGRRIRKDPLAMGRRNIILASHRTHFLANDRLPRSRAFSTRPDNLDIREEAKAKTFILIRTGFSVSTASACTAPANVRSLRSPSTIIIEPEPSLSRLQVYPDDPGG